VFEVLAPMQRDARIGMFFIKRSDYVKFSPDRFDQLKRAIKGHANDEINPKSHYASSVATLSTDKRKSKVGRDFYDLE
jgi:hypothetical protein